MPKPPPSGVKVRLNVKGFRALRTSDRMKENLAERATRIVAACGDGYGWKEAPSRNRARVTIYPTTAEAKLENERDLTIIRQLDAGRF